MWGVCMSRFKPFLQRLFAVVLILFSIESTAEPNIWSFSGVTFNDGAVVTGGFYFDPAPRPFGNFYTSYDHQSNDPLATTFEILRAPGYTSGVTATGVGYGATGEIHPQVSRTVSILSPTEVEFTSFHLGVPLAIAHFNFASELTNGPAGYGKTVALLPTSYEYLPTIIDYLTGQPVIHYVTSGNIVNAIPEPEIYAMLSVGLGLIGWLGRRKKLKERAAA